ncbi:MAG: transcriptional repressor [Erysipelotrichales bacterium]|nr:transcriptional repressor [Erysipelotrichales bacterium]
MNNYSQKREAILKALQSTDSHPTAEMLFLTLLKDYPQMGLATVYRNLKLFCRNGEAVSVGIINGQERFEARINQHGHFICDSCHSIIDVDFKLNFSDIYEQVTSKLNASIDSHNLNFHGKCQKCTKI